LNAQFTVKKKLVEKHQLHIFVTLNVIKYVPSKIMKFIVTNSELKLAKRLDKNSTEYEKCHSDELF